MKHSVRMTNMQKAHRIKKSQIVNKERKKASGGHNLLRLTDNRCLSCRQTRQAEGSSLENRIDIPVQRSLMISLMVNPTTVVSNIPEDITDGKPHNRGFK